LEGSGDSVDGAVGGVGASVLDVGDPALLIADFESEVLLGDAEFFAA
jgi:hypothetical protein